MVLSRSDQNVVFGWKLLMPRALSIGPAALVDGVILVLHHQFMFWLSPECLHPLVSLLDPLLPFARHVILKLRLLADAAFVSFLSWSGIVH